MTTERHAAALADPRPAGFAELSLHDLVFGFARNRPFLGPISWRVGPGEFWGVLGPNGAGKSTLLKLCCGLLRPVSGEVALNGRSIHACPPRRRARHITYLPQRLPPTYELTAFDVVLLARYPFRALNFFESAEDVEAARLALDRAGAGTLRGRRMSTLSGGEAQRVHLAACLAQDAPLLVLDEPTASLDVRCQIDVLRVVQDRVADGSGAAVVALHDVNLALRHCTHALLLVGGRIAASGVPGDVLDPERLRRVFGVRFDPVRRGDGTMTAVVVQADDAQTCANTVQSD
ncbi:MAG: Hemin import ATP-binding protein HmuV [Phycisphaerae bacterium]|nr:Hemin import ATP-binding protein HmuV [Phycisphaerae bacterium]